MGDGAQSAGLGRIPRSLGIAALAYAGLSEAYGSGPPYYGRTTNMDKRASPVQRLVVIDVIGIVVAAGLGYVGLRRLRHDP